MLLVLGQSSDSSPQVCIPIQLLLASITAEPLSPGHEKARGYLPKHA